MHPPSITGLYWSVRGEVACDEHAPSTDDPRWTIDGWDPIPATSGYLRASHYQCQHCATESRAIARSARTH